MQLSSRVNTFGRHMRAKYGHRVPSAACPAPNVLR